MTKPIDRDWIYRQRGHHDRRHRACPPNSQGAILVWVWPSSSWLVAEG
jgi:hypothetical protein